MFLRAFNRFNRFFPIGRRVSSSSIPIQSPDPTPGPVGFDYIKAALKWENIPAVVVALGFLGNLIYLDFQVRETATNNKASFDKIIMKLDNADMKLDNAVKELRALLESSAKENRALLESSAK